MIIVKPMAEKLIPDSAIGLSKLVVGQRPNHDLLEGQIVSDSDIVNFPWMKIPSVYLVHDLPEGKEIQEKDIYEIQDAQFNRAVEAGPSKLSSVVGKKARTNLSGNHHRLLEQEISP